MKKLYFLFKSRCKNRNCQKYGNQKISKNTTKQILKVFYFHNNGRHLSFSSYCKIDRIWIKIKNKSKCISSSVDREWSDSVIILFREQQAFILSNFRMMCFSCRLVKAEYYCQFNIRRVKIIKCAFLCNTSTRIPPFIRWLMSFMDIFIFFFITYSAELRKKKEVYFFLTTYPIHMWVCFVKQD